MLIKRLEVLANVTLVAVALIAGTVLVKNNFMSKPGNSSAAVSTVGTRLKVSGIDWKANRQTLVLALQTTCHFCTESAEFYRRLVSEVTPSTAHLTAILPQARHESSNYLRNLSVNIDDVREGMFNDFNVRGTPTLILVDGAGVIKNVWVGKLSAAKEKEVLAAVGGSGHD